MLPWWYHPETSLRKWLSKGSRPNLYLERFSLQSENFPSENTILRTDRVTFDCGHWLSSSWMPVRIYINNPSWKSFRVTCISFHTKQYNELEAEKLLSGVDFNLSFCLSQLNPTTFDIHQNSNLFIDESASKCLSSMHWSVILNSRLIWSSLLNFKNSIIFE